MSPLDRPTPPSSASSLRPPLLAGALFTLALAAPALGQQDGSLDTEEAPELQYVAERIEQLEVEMADRISQRRAAGEAESRLLDAQINLRLIARTLLDRGQEAGGEEGAIAILYGHTIADELDAADQWLSPPAQAPMDGAEAPPAGGPEAFTQAIQRFNEEVGARHSGLGGVNPEAVDVYLSRMLGPLADAWRADPQQDATLRSTWVGGEAPSPEQAARMIGPEQLDALAEAIEQAQLSDEMRQTLQSLVEQMRQQMQQPEQRRRLVELYPLLAEALQISQQIDAAQWVSEDFADNLRQQWRTAVLLIADDRTRPTGRQRLGSLLRVLDITARLEELRQREIDIEPMRRLLAEAHRRRLEDPASAIGGRLLSLIDQLTGMMLEYRALVRHVNSDEEPVQPQFARIIAQLRPAHERAERQVRNALTQLLSSPADIQQRRWDEAVGELAASLERMDRLTQIPQWIERMEQFDPRPRNGLFRQLYQIAQALTDESQQARADRALQALERQLETFDPMPWELALRGPTRSIERIIGDLHEPLVEQIERQRTRWATAWASGDDPSEPAQRLSELAQLMQSVGAAAELGDPERIARRLGRWGAWQGRAEAIRSVLRTMPNHVRRAAEFAANGEWSALDEALLRIREVAPTPMLLGRLHRRLADRLDALPDGAAGMLSQCLFPPDETDFAADLRPALARISIYTLEAAEADRDGDGPRASRLLEHVNRLSRDLLESRPDGDEEPS